MKTLIIIFSLITVPAWAQPPQIVSQPSTMPTTVWTPSGSYIIVPNYSTGQPQAVIQVSGTKTAKPVANASVKK